jgi:hypothetical protein
MPPEYPISVLFCKLWFKYHSVIIAGLLIDFASKTGDIILA